MVKIAIVEDDPADLEQLMSCLHRFEEEQGERFSVRSFSDPSQLLDAYRADHDLIFMDIELPLYNGMDAARQLRKMDDVVTLVFITNMEQYAVNGYEVDALDFVVKPIRYPRFSSMLRKALRIAARRSEREISIRTKGSIDRLRASQIYHVEIRDHLLIYHTDAGRIESWGRLSELEDRLAAYGFARCSSSHLVNLRHVVSVSGRGVDVAGATLPISQRRRKEFLARVASYLSGAWPPRKEDGP